MLVDQTPQSTQTAPATVNLEDPALYINREISWLQFNWRVLEEALSASHPLLERVKFLAIFAKNLDEFFMIRVSGLRRQATGGPLQPALDGMTPSGELQAILQYPHDATGTARGVLAPRPAAAIAAGGYSGVSVQYLAAETASLVAACFYSSHLAYAHAPRL